MVHYEVLEETEDVPAAHPARDPTLSESQKAWGGSEEVPLKNSHKIVSNGEEERAAVTVTKGRPDNDEENGGGGGGGVDAKLNEGSSSYSETSATVPSASVAALNKSGRKEKKPKVQKVSIRQLFRFADRVDTALMVVGTLAAMANGATMPAFSIIFGTLLDALSNRDPNVLQEKMVQIATWFVYAGMGSLVAGYVQNVCWGFASKRQVIRLRQRYLGAVMRQDMAWFDATGTGELISRISNDTAVIQDALGEQVGTGIQFSSTFFAGFIMGFVRCWQLTLLMLGVTPFLGIAGGLMMKVIGSMSIKGQQAYAQAGSVASEVLSAIRTVASFAAEDKETQRYGVNLLEARKVGTRKGFATGAGIGTTMFIMFSSYGLALWFGSYLIAHFGFTGGEIISVFFAVLMGAFALGQAAPTQSAIANGQGAAFKLYTTIDRKPVVDPLGDEGLKPDDVQGRLEFRNVVFRYPSRPEQPVFQGFNLVVEAGKTVALVGPSGAGKSSVVALLQRFYDPIEGQVIIDGKDISTLNLKWWRSHVGLVGQEPVLFSGTIADNISMGAGRTVTFEEIVAAAKSSNAHDFIMGFPVQYETRVGANGAQLSGGQKQRIAIARAVLKNPRVLLLDEATSALDTQSEKIVQAALDNARSGRTTIVIAHRLSTVRDADLIAVVDQGRITELGTHDQLKALKGTYWGLLKLQGLGDGTAPPSLRASLRHITASPRRSAMASSNISTIELERGLGAVADGDDRGAAAADDTADPLLVKKRKKRKVGIRRVLAMNVPEIPLLLVGTVAAAVNGASNPVFAVVFSNMVTVFYQPLDRVLEESLPWACTFIGIGTAALLANVVQAGAFGHAGEMLTMRVRARMFAAILRCDQGWFDDEEHSVGRLIDSLASQAALVQGMTGGQLSLGVQNMVTIIVGVGIAFSNGAILTAVVLACAPFIVMAGVANVLLMKGSGKKNDQVALANAAAAEGISNIRTTASFNLQTHFLDTFDALVSAPQKAEVRKVHIRSFLLGFGQLAMFSTYAFCFWYGGQLIVKGTMTFNEVLQVFLAIAMSSMAIGRASSMAPDLGKASGAAARVFDIIDLKPSIDSASPDGERLEKVRGDVELRNVHFFYPTRPEAPVLAGVDLKIEAGKVLALVGASGCGKSSIIGLLERFYDPTEGQLLIDGHDIASLHLKTLRSRVGLVSQEPVLFVGTIAQNISYSGPATQQQIEAAAKSANAHSFITSFPDGYNTQVGEKGAQLSGGQKQRIAIARAILKEPALLLLDEATSALDTESERVVQEALDHVMKGRTTIVVAHRLTTIRSADKIAVLHHGRVVEQGRHDELMLLRGQYFNLVRTQTSGSTQP